MNGETHRPRRQGRYVAIFARNATLRSRRGRRGWINSVTSTLSVLGDIQGCKGRQPAARKLSRCSHHFRWHNQLGRLAPCACRTLTHTRCLATWRRMRGASRRDAASDVMIWSGARFSRACSSRESDRVPSLTRRASFNSGSVFFLPHMTRARSLRLVQRRRRRGRHHRRAASAARRQRRTGRRA